MVRTACLPIYNVILIFSLFCFNLDKMVDSKHNAENYESLKIRIRTIAKYPEMIRFVPGYHKTKNCINMQLKICSL